VVDLIRGLDAARIAGNLERVNDAIAATGRSRGEVEILAAVKYVAIEELGVLAEAGITVLGENRAQELVAKAEAYPDQFTWDFIGVLQSRKVKQIAPYVRYIHSVASESALGQLRRHAAPDTKIMVEVNIAGDAGKEGIAPTDLAQFIARSPVPVVGLMTMPPLTSDPEQSRPYFRALAELAGENGLEHLSMGTSQDYVVAVQEGATIVRLGTSLYG
jgi:PLP dependent protein